VQPVRVRLLLLAVVLAAAAVAAGAALRSPADADAATSGFRAAGRWLVYPDGRVFVPHGVNTIVTSAPYLNDRLTAADARFLASEGFTAVRVAVLPSALEPAAGTLSRAYADRFVAQAALLARYGIATLVDLNQDRYAAACGGDGFPAWAVIGGCEDDAALSGVAAWNAFWQNAEAPDGAGLRDHYLAWWRTLAGAFASSPGVLGYDLLNEPKVADDATLADLWRDAIGVVRASDPVHVAFTEVRDQERPALPGSFPAGTGFTGHVYCATSLLVELAGGTPSAAETRGCIRDDTVVLDRQVAFARRAGLAYLVGEFGASDELVEQRALVDAMGSRFVPWLVYAYNGSRDSSGASPQGMLRDERKHGSQANAKQAKLDALVVPYPMAVAGTPQRWSYDRASRRVGFAYSRERVGGGSLARGLRTVVFVPKRVYPTGYAVEATGAQVVSRPTAPWVELVARPGAKTVRVTIRPRAGATTRTPLEANRCGFALRRCG
jgi:endoglycosylceramidase